MIDLIEILESFNRKERFFLISHALGLRSNSDEPAFSLSNCFRKQLNTNIDVAIPPEPEGVFVAMDYHLDWLQAALILAHTNQDEKSKFCNGSKEDQVIKGTQEDIDLLVAFKAGEKFHLILVEAKAYSGWTNKQHVHRTGSRGGGGRENSGLGERREPKDLQPVPTVYPERRERKQLTADKTQIPAGVVLGATVRV